MKNQHTNQTNDMITRMARWRGGRLIAGALKAVLIASLLPLSMGFYSANAQPAIRFTPAQVRVTVPVGFTNSTVITNSVNLTQGATNAYFDVSGLPAGASAVITDTNGNALLSTSSDTNMLLTINTTNLPEGLYGFSLNAGGLDTNGFPVTNSFPFILQAAHIWNGSLNASNGWSDAHSWLGGVPGTGDDAVFEDVGAQTNGFLTSSSIPFTNSFVTTSMTIGSLRFAQSGLTNTIATNPPPIYDHVHIQANQTLTISGTNGLSFLRDYLDDIGGMAPIYVTISGDAGAKLVVSNLSANAAVLVNGPTTVSTVNMSNLNTMVMDVNQAGFVNFRDYPNYRQINTALNVGRDTNGYSGHPARMTASIYLPLTNLITAWYVNPDNYANEYTRDYAVNLLNNEQLGISSSTVQNFILGISNSILADGVCFYGANGNGTTQFGVSNSLAIFRNTNGTSPLTIMSISDDGGTNEAGSNLKGTVDFSLGTVDILVNQLYLARDREQIATNNTPNVQATLIMGKGKIVANTAILGYQEHTKPDWTALGNPQPYLNYCQGSVSVTNGGTFTVNGNLTLGYTADVNDVNHANQFSTFGRITIFGGSTVVASNIVVDGGLNFYDSNKRQNTISIQTGGTLVVSNAIGGDNFTGSQYPSFLNPGSPCLPLDTLTMASGSTLTLFVAPGRTNVYVRNFQSSGATPGIIKIASLPVFPVYPTNISLIQYGSATPFVAADMSAIGGNVQGYLLNNSVNSTIDLFLTTNAPQTVTWTGAADNNWNLTSLNWVATNGAPTNFAMGDIAVFNDNASVTNIIISEVVVPNQATNGVVISNSASQYSFTGLGGSIAGTAKLVKSGTNIVTFSAAESGPFIVSAGELDVSGGFGIVASTTLSSNVVLKVISGGTVSGNVVGQQASVTVANGSTINGGLSLQGGTLVNDGNINVPVGLFVISTNAVATNNADGNIFLGGATSGAAAGATTGYEVFGGSTLANFGVITVAGGRLLIDGLYYGNGQFYDNVFPSSSSSFGRLQMDSTITASIGVGSVPTGTLENTYVGARLDMHQSNPQNNTGKFLVDVDAVSGNSDTITCARWNNIGCIWVMNNTNQSGTYTSGESFQVLVNANGAGIRNLVDTADIFPLMQPTVPAPGLQWNLANIEPYGIVAITNSTMVWDGKGDLTWDTNATVASTGNWKTGQLYEDSQGAIFDDRATGSTTVNLDGIVAPAGFNILNTTNTDHLTFTNIVQTSNAPSFMPGIVVSNGMNNYTFAGVGKITGQTSIYKTGPGTLTLLNPTNDFSGGMVIEGGTVAVTNVLALGFSGTFIGQKPAYNQIMIDNGTLKYFGTNNQSLGWFLTLNQDGATFEVSSNATVLTLNDGIVGTGVLTKTGAGVLSLSTAGDIYSSGTTVNQGTLRLTAAAAGTGGITLNTGTTLELTNATGTGSLTITNGLNVPGSATISILGVSSNVWSGVWTGAGSVTFNTTNSADLFTFNQTLTNFAGTISFGTSSSGYRFNNRTNDNPATGSASAGFNLGTGSASLYNLNGGGLTYDLGSLSGGPNTTLLGRSTNSITLPPGTIYRIGGNNNDGIFFGKIANGLDTVSVLKIGSGKLLLNGVNTYTGPTTVSNGIFGGAGSIASPLTVTAGGTLSPGAAPGTVGTFTVSNNVTLGGTVLMELNTANLPANSDQLVVTGTLSGGGALIVTNIGPDIYNNAKFQLFNKPVAGFTSLVLPTNNPAMTGTYTWANNLAVDGSITLVTGGAINPNPTNVVATVTNGVLTLTWPTDHTGWILQVQTNPLSVGLGTNWYAIPGSTNANSEAIPMDVTQGSIFYRLVLPQ